MLEQTRSPRLTLRTLQRNELGANQFVVLTICFGLILLTPIFVDFASLHFSRRVSQTAADAAALAAAVEDAQFWNLSRINHCGPCVVAGTDAQMETLQYIGTVLVPTAYNTGIGYPYAVDYASKHDARVIEYRSRWPSHTFTKIYYKEGIPIFPVAIYVKTERPADLIYQGGVPDPEGKWLGGYGSLFLTPAKATAEVYLYQTTMEYSVVCGYGMAFHCATYQWKVRLIRTID